MARRWSETSPTRRSATKQWPRRSSHHGRLDVFVNAAGVIVRASGEDTTDEQWARIMGVNVNGTFFMCRAALRSMKAAGRGSIVNFGSIWGDLGSVGCCRVLRLERRGAQPDSSVGNGPRLAMGSGSTRSAPVR